MNIPVMGCTNAAREVLNPMVLFKGKRVNEALQATGPPTWRVTFTDDGWMTGTVFEMWLAELVIPVVELKRVKLQQPT